MARFVGVRTSRYAGTLLSSPDGVDRRLGLTVVFALWTRLLIPLAHRAKSETRAHPRKKG